ncbi:MAG: PAS domain-containing protein [Terracidiphilus sp.]
MANLIRAYAWSATPLGPMESWSDCLLCSVNLMLACAFPSLIFWGSELVQFYNDAFIPLLAERHPSGLGQRAADCWSDAWQIVGPNLARVVNDRDTVFHRNAIVPIVRDGRLQDVCWTYNYSPIYGPVRVVEGVLVICQDVTTEVQVAQERDLLTEKLHQVFTATTDAVAVLDREWRITFLNDKAKAFLAPFGDIVGKNHWETFPASVFKGSPYLEHYYRAMDEGVPAEFEIYYPAPLNAWFQIIVRPAPDGIVLFFRDVTHRRRSERNLELLSDSGRALAQSLDFQTTLQNVAQVAIRSFSDFCYFDLVQPDGTIKRTAHLHRDPAQQPVLDAVRQGPLIPNPNHPVIRTINSRKPTIVEHLTDEWLRAAALNEAHLRGMRQLGSHTLLCVPIVNGAETLGTLTFCRTTTPGAFTEEDCAVAMELSRRVSAALVNVSLYRSMRDAQAVARSERERLRGLFMQAPAPIMTLDGPDHIVTLANEGYVRLLRKGSEREIIGKPLRRVLPELEGQGFFELLDNVYRTGIPYFGTEMPANLENKITGNLDQAWFNFVYQPARNADGQVDGVLVFAIEITEQVRSRKEAEIRGQLLERQTSELESIYKTAPIGLAPFDPAEFRYLRLNDTQAQIVGLPASQILGKTLTEIAPIEGLREMFQQVAQGKPIQNALLEGALPAQPDVHRYWTVNYFPVYAEDGTVQAITAASLEITAQKRAEQALIQSEKIAAVGRLASSIAHEINNPLESITNLLYLARLSQDVAQIQGHLAIADRELRRISLIANQTLRFYRQSTRPQAVQCSALIESVLTLYQGRLLNSNIQVETRHRATEPIVCFEGEIRQVLNNIVGNALDAMPRTGRLVIRSRVATNWTTAERGLSLTFADTGSGIPRDIQKRIFEPFFTTKGMNGTGLGLWISKDIVEKHHGSIRLRSSQRAGKSGTVFTLFLPFHPVPSDTETPLEP